jgi:hypothetical protein
MEYGWTHYKYLGWLTEDGIKLYEGTFKVEHDPYSWTIQKIRFYAKRPILAMRELTKKLTETNGKHIPDYEIIN